MSDQKTIAIIGGTIWGNRGAESMLVTTIGKLREEIPNLKFNVFSYYPPKDRELITDDNINILSCKPLSLATWHFFGALIGAVLKVIGLNLPKGKFFEIARALDESDMLLDIGGITFSDGREKYLPFNVLTIWPAMLLGTPVVKLAQALGPFKNRLNRFLAKTFLSKCKHVFARGNRTAEFLADIDLADQQADTVSDIAFLYKPLYSLSVENEPLAFELLKAIQDDRENGRKVIVCSPSILVDNQSLKTGLDYTGFFIDLLKAGEKNKFSVVFIPNASRQGSDQKHNNDLLLIKKIRNRFHNTVRSEGDQSNVYWVDYDINTEWVRNIISASDVLVTSRFHAMISGLALKIPTLVLGWGHKYRETMAYFEMSDYCVNFKDFDGELLQLIKDILKDKETLKERFDIHLPEVKKMAELQFEYLIQELS